MNICGPLFRDIQGTVSFFCMSEMFFNLKEYCSEHRLSLQRKENKKVYYESIHRNNICDCINSGFLCPYAMSILFINEGALDAISKNLEYGYTVDEIRYDDMGYIKVWDIDKKWYVINPKKYTFINTTGKNNRDRNNDTQWLHRKQLELATGTKMVSERKLTKLEHAVALASLRLEDRMIKNHPELKRRRLKP